MLRKLCRKGLSCVLAALALSVLTGCTHAGTQPPDPSPSNPPAQSSAETALPTDSAEEKEEAPFSLTMLDVGQGLAILVQADGKFLLYDGGGRETSSYVVAYLQQHGVAELDWLVASHYDEDHISGLVGVLHTTPVEQALMPDYTADTQIFQSLQQALREKKRPDTLPDPWRYLLAGRGRTPGDRAAGIHLRG